MNKLTETYKKDFISSVKLANKELYNFLNKEINKQDLQYSNTIGYGGDNSLNIDLLAEKIFIKHLEKFGSIYSEECGLIEKQTDFKIIIDPLDGSDNFKAGLDYYGSSVALEYKDETIAGFVCNLVNSRIIYRAFDSEVNEEFLDDKKFISKQSSYIGLFERSYKSSYLCEVLCNNDIKYRSPGASAVSLGFSKNFSFVMVYGEPRIFDIQAALYICKDLYIEKNDKFLLISKNKKKFELIKEIINYNRL